MLTLQEASDNILDGVLLANGLEGEVATSAETQAATLAGAGEWEQVGGGIPSGGFIDTAFRENAALDLDATSDAESIQRFNNNDTNTKADWIQSTSTFGVSNIDQ